MVNSRKSCLHFGEIHHAPSQVPEGRHSLLCCFIDGWLGSAFGQCSAPKFRLERAIDAFWDFALTICLFVYMIQIAQVLKPIMELAGLWDAIRSLAQGYDILMGLILFAPIAMLAWLSFVSEIQTRILFNQAFNRGLQISRILGGRRNNRVR